MNNRRDAIGKALNINDTRRLGIVTNELGAQLPTLMSLLK